MNLAERVADLEAAVKALGLVASGAPGPFRGNQHTGGFPGMPNPATPDPTPEKWAAYEKLHGRAAMIMQRAAENARKRDEQLGALDPTHAEMHNDKKPVADKHPPTAKQLKNLTRKDGTAPGHYGADGA